MKSTWPDNVSKLIITGEGVELTKTSFALYNGSVKQLSSLTTHTIENFTLKTWHLPPIYQTIWLTIPGLSKKIVRHSYTKTCDFHLVLSVWTHWSKAWSKMQTSYWRQPTLYVLVDILFWNLILHMIYMYYKNK